MPTEQDLTAAQQRVERADERASTARAERDDLIRAAIAGGMSAYRIAQLTGIDQARIGRIKRAG
ncbi:hypothetical protein EK0264_03830 [Epidermidibacterium keratini]|uniref:Helix-turn-helix domain-containing protein n=1 Tax=Epidermidibacterium keratini TaxID=1891644 RepID=A0A7L4YK56_9ACTN|nr:hypothetical protein [Epidermidibacterium keratini]QHB99499.1 hypothetical protein EK0264_03830 [Epidermidibacterium keratini]